MCCCGFDVLCVCMRNSKKKDAPRPANSCFFFLSVYFILFCVFLVLALPRVLCFLFVVLYILSRLFLSSSHKSRWVGWRLCCATCCRPGRRVLAVMKMILFWRWFT